jgi:hypothetical protein
VHGVYQVAATVKSFLRTFYFIYLFLGMMKLEFEMPAWGRDHSYMFYCCTGV